MISCEWFTGFEDLSDAYEIRKKVFIEEQNVPLELEMDGTDESCFHLVVYDDNRAVATGRILINNGDFYIGRVAVLKEERGKHYGDLVMRLLIRQCFEMGGEKQYIHAQTHAIGFYENLGFKAYGELFDDAGIEHIHMVREGDIFGKCQTKKEN